MKHATFENIHNAQRCISTIQKRIGIRKARKRYGKNRRRLSKVIDNVLQKCHLIGTSVENYYRLQFTVALLGLEYVWLPRPFKEK